LGYIVGPCVKNNNNSNKTKVFFFYKINKIDKMLARLIEREREREREHTIN
jgi:hypothetical protein